MGINLSTLALKEQGFTLVEGIDVLPIFENGLSRYQKQKKLRDISHIVLESMAQDLGERENIFLKYSLRYHILLKEFERVRGNGCSLINLIVSEKGNLIVICGEDMAYLTSREYEAYYVPGGNHRCVFSVYRKNERMKI